MYAIITIVFHTSFSLIHKMLYVCTYVRGVVFGCVWFNDGWCVLVELLV